MSIVKRIRFPGDRLVEIELQRTCAVRRQMRPSRNCRNKGRQSDIFRTRPISLESWLVRCGYPSDISIDDALVTPVASR